MSTDDGQDGKREGETSENVDNPHMYKSADKGWAWVVAIASMVIMVLNLGILRTLGIIMVDLMEVFEASASISSLIFTNVGIAFAVTAILLSTAFGGIIHERGLVTIAGLLGFAGLVASSFASRIEHVVLLGFAVGASVQIGMAATMSISGKYFRRRIGLANGIVLAGSSMGTLLFPPGVRFLLDEYTFRGALMILGALLSNAFVCAVLMRPPQASSKKLKTYFEMKKRPVHANSEPRSNESVTFEIANLEQRGLSATFPNSERSNTVPMPTLSKTLATDGNDEISTMQISSTSLEETKAHVNAKTVDYINEGYERNESDSHHTGHREARSLTVSSNQNMELADAETGHNWVEALSFTAPDVGGNIASRSIKDEAKPAINAIPLLESMQIFKTMKHFFLIDRKGTRTNVSFRKVFALDLFKDPAYLLFNLFTLFAAIAGENLVNFYPATVKEGGIPDGEAAYLVSIIGASDLCSRVAVGWFGDFGLIDLYKIVVVSQVLLGLATHLLFLGVTFWSQVIFSIIIGCQFGVYHSTRTVLLIDFFGLNVLPKTVGVTLFTLGLGMVLGSLLVGRLRDLTGSYRIPMHTLGSLFLLSGLLLCSIGILRKVKARNKVSCNMRITAEPE